MSPKIILADEPTGNLDSKNTEIFMNLLEEISKTTKVTIIIVTHDERICEYCDRTIRILDGCIS